MAEFWFTPFEKCYYDGPKRSVVSALSIGQVVLYEYYVIDSEYPVPPDSPDRTGPLYFVGKSTRVSASGNSQGWPTAVLMPASARSTAVQGESWGRVKHRTRSEP